MFCDGGAIMPTVSLALRPQRESRGRRSWYLRRPRLLSAVLTHLTAPYRSAPAVDSRISCRPELKKYFRAAPIQTTREGHVVAFCTLAQFI